jgi:hypothetical protein
MASSGMTKQSDGIIAHHSGCNGSVNAGGKIRLGFLTLRSEPCSWKFRILLDFSGRFVTLAWLAIKWLLCLSLRRHELPL